MANELVKRPLVTRLASPRPIWEIPLKGCRGSCAAPSVATRGGHPATLRPCIKIITRRTGGPTPPRAHLGRGAGGGRRRAFPAPQRPSRPRHGPGTAPAGAEERPPQEPGRGRRPAASQSAAGAAKAPARTLAGPEGGSPCASGPDRSGFQVAGWRGRRPRNPAVLLKRATQPRRGAGLLPKTHITLRHSVNEIMIHKPG